MSNKVVIINLINFVIIVMKEIKFEIVIIVVKEELKVMWWL